MPFTISINPTSGLGNDNYTVTVTSVGTFTGQVNLSCSMSPMAGCTLSIPSVNLSTAGSVATATCTVANVIQASTLTVTGMGMEAGSPVTSSVTASISPGNFTLAFTTAPGYGNDSYIVTVTAANNFSGTLNLTCSMSPTTGCSITPSVTLGKNGNVTATCTVGNVIQGSTLTVTATYSQGGATITASAATGVAPGSFTVDFAAATGNGNNSYTLSVDSLDRFAGTVNLTCAMSPTASCSVTPSVALAVGGAATATAMVGNVIQTSTLTVTGSYTQGGTTITASDTVAISAGSFSVTVTPGTHAGPWNYNVRVRSVRDFAGTVNLTSATSPMIGAMVSPASVTVPAGGNGTANCMVGAAGPATLTVTGMYTQGIDISDSGIANVT